MRSIKENHYRIRSHLYSVLRVIADSKAKEWIQFWNKQPDIFESSFVTKQKFLFFNVKKFDFSALFGLMFFG